MNIKNRLVAIAAAVAMAGVGLGLGAPEAQAIKRVNCVDFAYAWLYSNNTTCWADSGTAAVTLYSVGTIKGGSNSGSVKSQYGTTKFSHARSSTPTVWLPQDSTVTSVTITTTNF